MRNGWRQVALGEAATQSIDGFSVDPETSYTNLGVRWYAGGTFTREPKLGSEMKATRLYRVRPGQFIYNRMFVTEGSFATVASNHAYGVVSNEFPVFDLDTSIVTPTFLVLHFQQRSVWSEIADQATGTTKSRRRWKERQFLAYQVALPPLEEQRRILDLVAAVDDAIEASETEALAASVGAESLRDIWFQAAAGEVIAGDVYEISAGKQLQKSLVSGELVPYLRAANLSENRIDVADIKLMRASDRDLERLDLAAGDVLVVEGGFGYGKTAVWNEELPSPVIFQNHVLRIRSIDGRYSSEYASMWAKWCYEADNWRPTGTDLLNIGVGNARQMRLREMDVESLPEALSAAQMHDDLAAAASGTADALRMLRANVLTVLLSGEHEIPTTYDDLLGVA